MKTIDCIQGSEEWHKARLGIPTASRFDSIITPTGKPSKQADKYVDELIAEWLAGQPLDMGEITHWMQIGIDSEQQAREQFAFITDKDVECVGFCLEDQERYGASPDGLISQDEGLEIKCVKPSTLVSYYRDGFPKKYTPQIQANMLVTERHKWHFIAYNSMMKPFRCIVERDDKYIDEMTKLLNDFLGKLEDEKEKLKEWKVN